MNTKSLLTRIGVPVLSLGLLGGLGATLATSASAATQSAVLTASIQQQPGTVYATTHENGVDDTTTVPTGYEDPGGNGPIWAYDTVERQLTAVPQSNGTWQVTLHTVGTYNAFANPLTGSPWTGQGRMDSTSTWTVTIPAGSNFAPSKANLPAQTDPSFRSQHVVSEFFGAGKDGLQPNMTGGDWYYYGIPGANDDGVSGLMHQHS